MIMISVHAPYKGNTEDRNILHTSEKQYDKYNRNEYFITIKNGVGINYRPECWGRKRTYTGIYPMN